MIKKLLALVLAAICLSAMAAPRPLFTNEHVVNGKDINEVELNRFNYSAKKTDRFKNPRLIYLNLAALDSNEISLTLPNNKVENLARVQFDDHPNSRTYRFRGKGFAELVITYMKDGEGLAGRFRSSDGTGYTVHQLSTGKYFFAEVLPVEHMDDTPHQKAKQ